MNLVINNRPEILDVKAGTINIEELLIAKNFTYKMLMVRVNGKNVKRDDYQTTLIRENDNVEVIHLISGG
jgi:thiamine biosynthesis protein ThiS